MDEVLSAQQVHANSIAYVFDNDEGSYNHIMTKAREVYNQEGRRAMLSDFIAELYNEVVDPAVEHFDNITSDLIRSIVYGWGQAPFDLLADNYLTYVAEELANA